MRDLDAAPKLNDAEVDRVFREESVRSVAALLRVFSDIDVAEDAVQEAFAVALRKWPTDGVPPNPGARRLRPSKAAELSSLSWRTSAIAMS